MRYLLHTFGCQMNVHDSERIEDVLADCGYEPTDSPADADVIVVNTCSVREKAEHKLMSLLGRLAEVKEARPETVIVVAGCVAQQEGERLLARAPFVDLVLGPDNIVELPELLHHVQHGGPPMTRTVFDVEAPEFLVARPRSGIAEPSAYVTIMKGCDERCTFCVVPYTRGPERYRPADDVVGEVRVLVERGVREVTLLGQTVNSWYEPGSECSESQFPSLLRKIASEVPGLLRLRYTSPHPRHVNSELVLVHAELDVLAAHVHLPVQSGSDRVLRRMRRKYTRTEYIGRARALSGSRHGFTLSTDFIVGFPGETEADFRETLSLIDEAELVAAFAFKYSPRPHTPSLNLADDVTDEVKSERLNRLFEAVAVRQSAHLQGLVGTHQRVLVEGPGPGVNRFRGRTGRNEIVHFTAAPGVDPTGDLVEVRVEQAHAHSLAGEPVGVLVPKLSTRGSLRRLRLIEDHGVPA